MEGCEEGRGSPLLLFPSDVTRIPAAAAAVAAPPTANAMATDERAHGHVSRANGPPRPEPPLVGDSAPDGCGGGAEGEGIPMEKEDSPPKSVEGEKRSRQDLCCPSVCFVWRESERRRVKRLRGG